MNALALFRRKLRETMRYYTSIIKTVTDWTVWLYLFIPGMLFLIVFYLYYLGNTSPSFIHFMDKYLFFVFFFYLLRGKIRTFLEKPDEVFSALNKPFIKKIVSFGILYSSGKIIVTNFLLFALLYPFLCDLSYSFSFSAYIITGAILQLFRSLCFYIIETVRWRYTVQCLVKLFTIFAIALALYSILYIHSLSPYIWGFGSLFVILLIIVKVNGPFFIDKEIERELSNSNRLREIILQQADALDYKSKPNRLFKGTYLFRNETIENTIIDSFIKTTIRNSKTLRMIAQIVLYSLIAIIVISNTLMKEISLLFVLFLFKQVVNNEWRLFIQFLKDQSLLNIQKVHKLALKVTVTPYFFGLVAFGAATVLFYSLKEAIMFLIGNGILFFLAKRKYF
ncbi:ABC transporter permease [Priestia filamentosa]|uniref:ABC transporter permease n=1 Tax=Priestia filamentosa TaxID=1402861 RepID=UPI00234AA563|nr:ABC transporter permease [Priestia filamentosa]WCM17556.1 ABC transporter permease [Priestia filamentosa]